MGIEDLKETSPEELAEEYKEEVANYGPEQLVSEIRKWKRFVNQVRYELEFPGVDPRKREAWGCLISLATIQIDVAKAVLAETGHSVPMTQAEKKASQFDEDLRHISEITLSLSDPYNGSLTTKVAFDGNAARCEEYGLSCGDAPPPRGEFATKMTKRRMVRRLRDLRICEWQRTYDPAVFGLEIDEGTQWSLEIKFSNGRRTWKSSGLGIFPYGYEGVLELFINL